MGATLFATAAARPRFMAHAASLGAVAFALVLMAVLGADRVLATRTGVALVALAPRHRRGARVLQLHNGQQRGVGNTSNAATAS